MWCRIDFTRFVQQLLPPILRSKVMMALFRVFITPIRYLYDKFLAYKDGISSRLNITANVQYIQKALNDAFFLSDNQIFIETPKEVKLPFFHFQSEGLTINFFHRSDSTAYYMGVTDEASCSESFIVYVPSFLCTSLDSETDKYLGQNIQTIYNLLDYYKPVGRTCRIEIYDYE